MTISISERKIAGGNIRRLREAAGLSVTDAARELEIERTYFHDIENGSANVTFEKYERIAGRFGVTVRQLLELDRSRGRKFAQPRRKKTA